MSRRRAVSAEGIVIYGWIIALCGYFGLLVWAFGRGWGFVAFIGTLIWLLRRWDRT